jgi:hypothetical protein
MAMLENRTGHRLSPFGSAPHWKVFSDFLPEETISNDMRRAVAALLYKIAAEHEVSGITRINSTIDGSAILRTLSTDWTINCAEWLIAYHAAHPTEPKTQIVHLLGMMFWHLAALDTATVWLVGEENKQRTYDLVSTQIEQVDNRQPKQGFLARVATFLDACFPWPTHCPHCMMEIRQGATACPHCTRNIFRG